MQNYFIVLLVITLVPFFAGARAENDFTKGKNIWLAENCRAAIYYNMPEKEVDAAFMADIKAGRKAKGVAPDEGKICRRGNVRCIFGRSNVFGEKKWHCAKVADEAVGLR